MNQNTRSKKAQLAKEFAQEHKSGRKIVPPTSQRKSPWRGATNIKHKDSQ